jgi:hypothetical protein
LGNLRKLVASALTASDLSDSSLLETALDRIGALAFTDELGARLWRVKWGGSDKDVYPALALLAKRCHMVARQADFRYRLCEAVLQEWLDDQCRKCRGRGFTIAPDTAVRGQCTACEGAGLRRYSDQWRMNRLGLDRSAYQKWERRFAAVHERIAEADGQAWRDVARQLERIHPRFGAQVLDFRAHATRMRAARDELAQKNTPMPEYFVSSATG